MIRLYVCLTNSCNANCEFCCMWSSSNKKTYMAFETFKSIIDSKIDDFELQLEGGEPLLHKDLYLFMEYAVSTGRCKKIIILSNGILLDNHLPRFVDFNKYHKVPIQIKMSINYWLLNMNNNLIEDAINYHLSTKYIDGVDMFYNVRMRHSDEYLKDLINNSVLKDVSNIFYLQRYGKYKDEEEYDLPFIVQNIDDWFLYSTDGTCFNKDIIARSNYEKELD